MERAPWQSTEWQFQQYYYHVSDPLDEQVMQDKARITSSYSEMSDDEILSLLAMTQQQLSSQQASAQVKQEFLASCWQLCGVGCAAGDQYCVDQHCNNLCSLSQTHKQPTMHDLLSEQQRKIAKNAQSAKELIHEVAKQPRKNDDVAARVASGNAGLPEDFVEEEKILQQRRLPVTQQYPDYDQFEEETKDALQDQPARSHSPVQLSNDMLGEMFADQQAEIAPTGLDVNQDSVVSGDQISGTQKTPAFVFPLVGGLAIILVFCAMIGFLILEPGTREQMEAKRKKYAKRRANLKKVAMNSWTVQPERLDNQVSGYQAQQLDNQVYKRL